MRKYDLIIYVNATPTVKFNFFLLDLTGNLLVDLTSLLYAFLHVESLIFYNTG